MEAEDLKRGVVSILLVFALVFSMISVAPLAHSGDVIYDPSSENIEVERGDTFLIRHTLEWNEPENGAYTVTIAWDCHDNKPSENFTFVSASAYFDNNGDNIPDPGVDPILAVTNLVWASSPDYPGSTRHALTVKCPIGSKDSRNGQFNVDITLGAYGAGGVPHIPGDHVIPWQFGGIIIVEKYPQAWPRDPITIRVGGRGVSVSIEPSENSGLLGDNVSFTVTVTNTGNLGEDDNYDLTVSDDAGWGDNLALSENQLNVPENESRTATLTVTIPDNAENCTRDNITITVRSQTDNTVEDSTSCIAHALVSLPPLPGRGVQVSTSPDNRTGWPGENLTFTVTVKNTGDVTDNYILTMSDNAGWGPTLAENLLTIPAGENRTTTASVTVPSDAIENESTQITVTATSQTDTTVENSAECTAKVKAGEAPPSEFPWLLVAIVVVVGVIIVVILVMRPFKTAPATRFKWRR